MLDNNELKDFYKNRAFYIKNKKYKLEIDHINKSVLVRSHKNINQIFIKYKSINRDNEIIEIVLKDKKINIIEMFMNMWKEDA